MRQLRLLLSTALIAFTATTALAQSSTRNSPDMFEWTGFYAGLNAGGVADGSTRFDRTTGSLPNNTNALTLGLRPTAHTIHDGGFTGGGQIGYNFELADFQNAFFGPTGPHVVTGLEADAAYTDLNSTDVLSNTANFGPLDAPSTTPFTRVNQYRGQLKYLGTVRGRLGLAFDQTLIYGTGGLAYGDVERETVFYGPNAPATPFFQGSNNGTKLGYVVGGGAEFAMPTGSFFDSLNFFHSTGVTLKLEYLHYDLSNDTLTFPGVNGGATIGGYTSRVRTSGDLARAGINYKF